MSELISFAKQHIYFCIVMFVLNCILVMPIIVKAFVKIKKINREAQGGIKKSSILNRIKEKIEKNIESYERGEKSKSKSLYAKAKYVVNKAGYRGKYAATIYICIKYILPVFLFLIAYIINFPNLINPLLAALLTFFSVDIVLYSLRRDLNLRFQKYAYKIYQYLHNQISSGVNTVDAMTSCFEIIDDEQIKMSFQKFASMYELTSDINLALEEFKVIYSNQEAETLAIAIRQGIETGDNKDILEAQEYFMFNRYMNYIQSETDRCQYLSLAAALLFCSIIVIMLVVPMVIEALTGINNMLTY